MNSPRETVDEYLRALRDALPASDRVKRSIVAEVGDGLYCSVEAHRRRGLGSADAARAAVAEFGDPRQLAADFARQLTSAAARRTGQALVLTGPLIGLTWAIAFDERAHWFSNVVGLLETVPLLPLALVVGIPAAVFASQASRPGGGATAIVAAIAAVSGDALLLGWLLAHTSTATAMLLLAAGMSVARAAMATARVHRLARLRATAY